MRPTSIAKLREEYITSEGTPMNTPGGTYQFVRHDLKEAGRWVELFAPCAIRPSSGEITAYPPAEKYGASTRSTLRMLGFKDPEIEDLLAKNVISTGWSRDCLPE